MSIRKQNGKFWLFVHLEIGKSHLTVHTQAFLDTVRIYSLNGWIFSPASFMGNTQHKRIINVMKNFRSLSFVICFVYMTAFCWQLSASFVLCVPEQQQSFSEFFHMEARKFVEIESFDPIRLYEYMYVTWNILRKIHKEWINPFFCSLIAFPWPDNNNRISKKVFILTENFRRFLWRKKW